MARSESTLAIERVGERSVVVASRAEPPLRLLAPKNHGHAAWVYQSSLGGGFVREDDVALSARIGPNATLLLATQSTSKAYARSRGRSLVRASVADGATLVLWPDVLMCFRGASFRQRTELELTRSASLLAIDSWSAGRLAHGERWAFEDLSLSVDLTVGEEHVL